MTVPENDARYARDRRLQTRRTGSGERPIPWEQIADELAAEGRKYSTADLQDAVARLPIEDHPDAPLSPAELAASEQSWRAGWATEFPGEEWPGLGEARRRIGEKNRAQLARMFEAGPGFVRAVECPKCGHTKCGPECRCGCWREGGAR